MVPLTTTDYPGGLAAVLFCQGCPWRCAYCQNTHLIPPKGERELAWSDVLAFLRRRIGLLDAVVFSGGEPSLQQAIVAAARQVRGMGFKLGLHTAGPYPERLAEVLPELDWVGMDVKAGFADYAATTGVPGSGAKAQASARLLLESGIAHEFRTTWHPALMSAERLRALARTLAGMGVRRFALQAFRATGCADAGLNAAPAVRIDEEMLAELAQMFAEFVYRPA
ncbi:MAG: anaerobic ribonucleoside-triphosphate reductase activating protein [Sulfuricellaceae bacterium]|nr:anaerobic ribonucleoside-triphosphate reductase activating protein [Sulfuricellaceae bacterium]